MQSKVYETIGSLSVCLPHHSHAAAASAIGLLLSTMLVGAIGRQHQLQGTQQQQRRAWHTAANCAQ